MKKILVIISLFLGLQVHAQSTSINEGIYFQAVAKDNAGHPAVCKSIYVQTGIYQQTANGMVVFGDLHQIKTDDQGVFGIMIGQGEVNRGTARTLKDIHWSEGPLFLNLKIAIQKELFDTHWDYTKEWVDLGTSPFGAVPFAMSLIGDRNIGIDSIYVNNALKNTLNISDTATMLKSYLRISDYLPYKGVVSYNDLMNKPTLFDSNYNNLINKPVLFSGNYADLFNKPSLFSGDYLDLKNKPTLFSKNYNDLTSLPDLSLKENVGNKSNDITIDANSIIKYPSVYAVKNYVDATVLSGAPDANATTKGVVKLSGDLTGTSGFPLIASNAISTIKVQDAAITDAKIAYGINPAKLGLENVSNHAQMYSLNGLISQVQYFANPGTIGFSPNWISMGNTHSLHIPMASASSVTAGLISNSDYIHFTNAYSNSINAITNNGNYGPATIVANTLNIPQYSLGGLAGNVNANTVFAGPVNGSNAMPNFRTLVSSDIPDNGSNTTGNAATASALQNPVLINNTSFNGTNSITITANTSNDLNFNQSGTGDNSGISFNGATAKTISYNTIGASPLEGSANLTTAGTITTGTWSASVIGSNVGGAGDNNGILKANGLGVVSTAVAGSDYQLPLAFATPLINSSNTISLPQANATNNGYITSTDWLNFNQKIDGAAIGTQNGVASLDANGKVPTSQIPSISFSSGYVVSSQSAMLALSSAVIGSIAIRTDNSKNYVLSGLPASTLGNWLELLMPASINSVNGYTQSSITLTSSDIAEGSHLYYTDTRSRNALSVLSPLNYNTSSGVFSLSAASASSAGYLTASDWNIFNSKQATIAAGTGVTISGGNTIQIGQNVASTASPSFAGLTIAGDLTARRYKLTMPSAITAVATTNIDLSLGNVFTVNLGLNSTTLTTSNPVVGTYLIKFVQDATGSREVTFPAGWKWAGGFAPNLTNTANKTDIVTLIYDGSTYYATIVQNF